MSLADVIRAGVRVADRVAGTLQVQVKHRAALLTMTRAGESDVDVAVDLKGFLDRKRRRVKLATGEERQVIATLFIPRLFTVTTRDQFLKDDVSLGEVLEVRGLDDPAGGTYYTEVLFG
jgi:hypothetical protein